MNLDVRDEEKNVNKSYDDLSVPVKRPRLLWLVVLLMLMGLGSFISRISGYFEEKLGLVDPAEPKYISLIGLALLFTLMGGVIKLKQLFVEISGWLLVLLGFYHIVDTYLFYDKMYANLPFWIIKSLFISLSFFGGYYLLRKKMAELCTNYNVYIHHVEMEKASRRALGKIK